jgi:hypothetical protein
MSLDVRRIRRIALPLLALLVVAAGVAACGGDDGTSADDKTEYIEQLNDAQEKFAAEVQKLNLRNPSSAEGFKQSLDGLDPLLSGIVSDLRAIEPPDEVKAEHDRLISLMQGYQKTVKDNKEGVTSGEQQRTLEAARAIATGGRQFQTEFRRTISQINSQLRE